MKLLKAEAGVNDGKAGLLSTAGLFAKGGIFDKKSESFNIQELDPYLLFDARSSMLGTLENPTLDLDPATPSTLDVITATRSGTATYTDADGLIATAPANTVRVDYVDSVPMILVEPSATNLFPYSEDFGVGGWAITSGTLTKNYTISPDGLQNGSKINFSTGGELVRTTNFTAGQIYTLSFYAKVESGSFDFTYGNIDYTLVAGTATTEWQRFEVTQTAPVATRYPKIDATDTGDLLIWGAQLEAGSVATSYIPTSGGDAAARTRAADDLAITGSAFTNFFNSGGDGTFYAEFVPEEIETVNNIITGHGGGGGGLYLYSNVPTYANVRSYDGTLATSYGDATNNEINRASVSYNSSTFKGSLNGSSEDSTSHNGTFSAQTSLQLGYNVASPISFKRVIYWPTHSSRL